ncbi:MAG: transglutaminase-like putative cysteine protease [Lentimonas sp.]|jgi:transglutaminase-like putative cysteine protease
MVVWLLAFRALAPRNRREDLQMLLLSLLSIVVSGAITVSLLFAVQILLFAPIAMVFLLIVCLLDRGAESANYRPSWEQFSLRKLMKRVWGAVEIRAFALGGLLFAFVVILSTGFFILIPRFDLGQTIPFMQMETKPRSGFSDTVSLNSVSEIIKDRSIALRLDVPDLAAISSLPYWRILVLDRYQKGEFSLSKNVSNFRQYKKLRELSGWTQRRVPAKFRKGEQWTFYFEGGVSQYLPLPTMFQAIRFTKEQAVELLPDLHVIGLDAVQKSTFSYQIDDLVWDVRAPASNLENKVFDQHLSDENSENEGVPDYPLTTLDLALSDDDKALLANLNGRLTRNTNNLPVAEYSERVTLYLRENFRYSLNPDGVQGSGDPIVNWIDDGSTGHCELYAGAFILLAREAGYPARMVVGFVGGSWNAVENFFVVRNSDAHAWAEIYDAKTDEWLRVDPTPGGSAADPEVAAPVDFEIETGMWAWVDSLRMQWYRRIINFDQDDQVELATSLIDMGDSFLKKLSTRFQELITSIKVWISRPFSLGDLLRLGVALGFCFGLYYLWRTFFSWSGLFLRLFRKSEALSPIRKRAARYMSKVRLKMSQPGTDEVYAETLRKLYSQLEALRFGPSESVEVAVPIFKKTRKVLWGRKGFSS